jgi:hypothetical protein
MIEMTYINEKLTLCETIRIINDHFQGDDERSKEIRDLLCLCLYMAKRMARKLREYNEHWDADWLWANNIADKEALIRAEREYKFGSKEQALETLKRIARINENITDTVSE